MDVGASIDELLDRAVAAINRGDRAAATDLAGQVLAADGANADAEDLLAAPSDAGEIRRLTMFFADLVDSTALSTRVEPETYRLLVGRYRELVQRAVARYEGHIGSTKGDGLLAVFGHPVAHEDDVRRAVHAGLEITREVHRLSDQAKRRYGIEIDVRVGVHRGLVYLDTAQDDVYGLAANLAARVSSLAPPGAVVVSDAVELLIRNDFELVPCAAAPVKGVAEPMRYHQVVTERARRRPGHGPVVGRDRELACLAQSWAGARAGALSAPGVVFCGEAGIGKSRLAAAAVEMAEASGSLVLELVGSPFHTDAGLHPVRTMLERRCGIDRSTDQAGRLRLLTAEVRARGLDPRSAVPLLAPVLGVDARFGYEPVAAEGRKLYELIAQSVRDYLLACLDCSALVVAEDVHWFDPSTREVLGALLDGADGRLLIVITGRPGDWLPGGWPATVFELSPLTDEQTDALISALNPGLTVDERNAVAARGDGVPFYIEQVVAGLGASGVPETLYEPLFARLRASPKVVPVVEAAAVIGRHVDRGLLGSVVDLSDDEVDDVIDELEDALVFESGGSDGWRFRHELLREVAAELAPPTVRRGLHAKVADALVRADGDPDWRLVAAHYERAERFDEAASAYEQASSDARRRGALAEARAYLTQTLDQLERATPGPERDRREMAARLRRGVLTSVAEGYQSRAAATDFERCLQLGGTDLDDDVLFATLTALANYCLARADLHRATRLITSLRAGVERRPWFGPAIEMLFGLLDLLRGDFAAARRFLELATASASAAGDHDQSGRYPNSDAAAVWRFVPNEPIASAHAHLALVGLVRGDLDGAKTELAVAARRVEALGFPQGPYMLLWTLFMETWLRIEAGQFDDAVVLAADLRKLAEQHGFDIWQMRGGFLEAVACGLALSSAEHFDPTELAAHTTTSTTFLDVMRTGEVYMYGTFYSAVLGQLLIGAGQPEQARACLQTGLQLATDAGMHFYDAELLRLRAQTHDDPAAQRADLDAALELARHQGACLFELRAALDDFDSRGEPARAALADAVSRMPGDCTLPEVGRARAHAVGRQNP